MRHFVALTFEEGRRADRGAIERSCERRLEALDPEGSAGGAVRTRAGATTFLAAVAPAPVPATFFVGHPPLDAATRSKAEATRFDRPSGEPGVTEDPAGLVPPWALVRVDGEQVRARTDACGLGHVHHWQGNGVAAISSSASLLGALAGGGADPDALGSLALLGQLLGTRTVFRGVSKLDAGSTCRCARGRIEVHGPAEPEHGPPFGTLAEAVEAGREALRAIVADFLEAFPGAGIELSGGLDSRLLLAAIPPPERPGRNALTIGDGASRDVRIARALAASQRLQATFVDFERLRTLESSEVVSLVRESAARVDFASNPFARAVLEWVHGEDLPEPRFSGQGGEYARGFYYAAQKERSGATSEAIRSLARWRILAHAPIAPGILEPRFEVAARRRALEEIEALFTSSPGSWLERTDEFYRLGRLQHWVGATYSRETRDRHVLCPLFDRRFTAWVRRTPVRWRRGSIALAGVLASLDPGLARPALDSGSSPARMCRPGLASRVDRGRILAGKAWGKLLRRLSRSNRAPSGAPSLVATVLARGGRLGDLVPLTCARPETASGLADVPLSDRRLDWVTLGWLMNVERLLEESAAHGPGPGSTRADPGPVG